MTPPMDEEQLSFYTRNLIILSEAIARCGGSSIHILEGHHDLIETLSRNGIELDATYCPHVTTKDS